MTERPRLGVQVHCLRHRLARDFEGTLREIAALGVHGVELVSFPGCRGNPWGDFGALADRKPEEILVALRAAGLESPSSHVMWRELDPASIGNTVEWLQKVGVRRAVLAAAPVAVTSDFDAWLRVFDRLNTLGEHMRRVGLDFAYHTQADLWRPVDNVRPADELLKRVDPRVCRIEYDPSGALMYGLDPAEYLRARPEVFWALHLRDGARPAEPVPYLPALPLGAGEIDLTTLLSAAQASAIEWSFLEMEVAPPESAMAALRTSCTYLREHA